MRIPTFRYLLLLISLGCLIRASRVEAQGATRAAGPSQPPDSLWASWVRPPATPPFDGYDAVALPFRIATLPVKVLGRATAWAVGQLTKPGPPPFYTAALIDVSDWGLVPGIGPIGPRSGITGRLTLERYRPFFLQTALSVRGSQRHAVGLALGDEAKGGTLAYTFTRNAEPHFWGIGPESRKEARSDYLWDQSEVALAAQAQPHSRLGVAGGVAFEDNRVARGFDGGRPDLQDNFDTRSLFGASERTKYFRFNAYATFDLTRWRGLQQRGFWIEAGSALFVGTDGTDSHFHRFHGELRGYLPLNPRQQLAVRGLVEMNRGDSGRGVPFTHLASAGSLHGQRGFSTGRFRDRDMVAVMAEWRYEVWRELHERGRVETFVFFDESGVARSLPDLSTSDLRAGYGLGMRVVWQQRVAFVWYLGLSEETTRLRAQLTWPF